MITGNRGVRTASLVVLTAAAALLSLPTTSIAAEPGLTVTATSAQVNETGAVTVSGNSSCAAGVTAYYGADVPAKLTIFINVMWTASQRAASATGPGGRAAPCYNDNPDLPGVPIPQLLNCGTLANPCPWYTWMFDGTGANQSFFGSGFKPGRIHVALQSGSQDEPTGIVVIDGVMQVDSNGDPLTIGLTASSSGDLAARRCNSLTGRPAVCEQAPVG